MKLYIAGPMRGIPEYNFPKFFEVEAALLADGDEVFSPARRDVDIGFQWQGTTGNEDLAAMGFDLRDALAVDLEWICRHADGVVLLPGWEKSSVATAEEATARALGLTRMLWGD